MLEKLASEEFSDKGKLTVLKFLNNMPGQVQNRIWYIIWSGFASILFFGGMNFGSS